MNEIEHIVQEGETIYSIAALYGVLPNDIAIRNSLYTSVVNLQPDQRLIIPISPQEYFIAIERGLLGQEEAPVQETTPEEFDPDLIAKDTFYLLTGGEIGDDLDAIGSIEFFLLDLTARHLVASGMFEHLPPEVQPDSDAIRESLFASLGENYSAEDVAALVNDIAYSLTSSGDSLPHLDSVVTHQLLEMSGRLLLAFQLDEIRQVLNKWDSEREAELLAELGMQIVRMPASILGVPVTGIRSNFVAFHAFMYARYTSLKRWQEQIGEIEAAYAAMRAAAQGEMQLIQFLALLPLTAISMVFKPLDWLMSALDFLATGDPLALSGFIPLIPGSLRRLGRIARSFPGVAIDLWRYRQFIPDMGASNTVRALWSLRQINLTADVTFDRAMRTALLANEYGFEIHIAGRTADTAAEASIRLEATRRALELAQNDPELARILSLSLLDNPVELNRQVEILKNKNPAAFAQWREIQLEVAREFNDAGIRVGPFQVSVSTGKSEVDVYISPEQWSALGDRQEKFIEELQEIYGVGEVDVYTEIKDLPTSWIEAGWLPTNPPPGAIVFSPDGTVTHIEIGQ